MIDFRMACPNVTEEENCMVLLGALKVMHFMFFSQNGLLLDHSVIIGMTVSGQYYCALLQDKVRPALHHKQPELLEHGITLLQDSAVPLHNCDLQTLV